jgi:SAM-dependent methyltransferase
MRRREGAREHLDGPVAADDLAASLADVDRLSAWFGGHALTLTALNRALGPPPPGATRRVLDVGGGGAHLARRLVRRARRAGRRVRVVVLDVDAGALALGRALSGAAYPEIAFVRADASALPLREGAVDAAVSVLTLHHLEADGAAAALAEMRAASRGPVIVNDLLRSRLALALVWLATRLVARHPFSRHDGPLSVRRAWAPAEMEVLADKAGVGPPRLRRHPLLGRLLAVWS